MIRNTCHNRMKTKLINRLSLPVVSFFILSFCATLTAKDGFNVPDLALERTISPSGALLRSFVVPGWGHYYIDQNSWKRGQLHLGVDIALLGSWAGVRIHANQLERSLHTLANHHAGVSIKGRGRDFTLIVAEYPSLDAYNEFQLRSRNWDRIMDNHPDNYWNWDSEQYRLSFMRLDSRIQNRRQQLPAIVSLMIVNRLISGIHAYTVARSSNYLIDSISLYLDYPEEFNTYGYRATLRYAF